MSVLLERDEPPTAWLHCDDGARIELDVRSWSGAADAVEERLLATMTGPVLDVGCGPGRLVASLMARGVPALGVDASPVAVGQALARRAPALVRSVFDPLPGTGRWATVLLMDGNVGIGGDPRRLLDRVAQLAEPQGRVEVEVEAPGVATARFRACVVRGEAASDWFGWARVGVDGIEAVAGASGMSVIEVREDHGRWFAELRLGGAP